MKTKPNRTPTLCDSATGPMDLGEPLLSGGVSLPSPAQGRSAGPSGWRYSVVHEVVHRVEELSDRLRKVAAETESLGKLSDESVRVGGEAGVMRLLQPPEFGGYAAHPRDFAEAVMAVSKACGATGWVCGVGGVHPWELALMDRRLQEEVWGADPDTWIASPYAPTGVADPVDGGYRLKGRWQFSSGTDHCDWIFLGALVGDGQGGIAQPFTVLH